MKKAILLTFLLCGCDSASNNAVSVLYEVTGTGTADVWVFGEDGERIEADGISGGWQYAFGAEEGTQLLYVRLTNVQGQLEATIKASDVLLGEISASDGYTRGVSAWGSDEGVALHYSITSESEGAATFSTPAGTDSLSASAFAIQQGPYRAEQRTYTVPAGFGAAVSAVADSDDFGCISARIQYEPLPGVILDLAGRQVCGSGVYGVNVGDDVPGYAHTPLQ